ncbi:hypothetical protein [Coleofasciculus sp. H7-2]|uniref:hypothetical protein n=1 Tax=Coleofasciculus sp. H7-2 TaxID=3351545 RepID=UPI00366DB77C
MFDKILTFVTPGPMTERFSFGARVFYSWISLGLILALVGTIIALSLGQTIEVGALIAMPIVVCLSGLFGLGLDSIRGRNTEYPGWYWLLFPILTYLVIGFGFAFLVVGFVLGIGGVRLPEIKNSHQYRHRKINPKEAKDKIRREVKRQQSKKFLDEYEKRLIQQQREELNSIQREQLAEQEKRERLESLSIRDRILLKLRENPGTLLENILTEEEMEELAIMLLELLLEG